jgi:hypothetical protein
MTEPFVDAGGLAPFIRKANGQQVLRAFRSGHIPGHRVGRRVLFSVGEVLDHIKADKGRCDVKQPIGSEARRAVKSFG